MKIDWGNVPDWISGLGGVLSVIFVTGMWALDRRKRLSAEHQAEALDAVYQAEIAASAIEQLRRVDLVLQGHLDGPLISSFRTALDRPLNDLLLSARSRFETLSSIANISPILRIALLDAAQACEIEDRSVHDTYVQQAAVVGSARKRIKLAQARLSKHL